MKWSNLILPIASLGVITASLVNYSSQPGSCVSGSCCASCLQGTSFAVHFDTLFAPQTLRLNLTLAGNDRESHVYLESMDKFDGWAGRRQHLDSISTLGNGRAVMRDAMTHQVIYSQPFNMLFEEWQATDEAKQVSKSMEQVVLFPMPKCPAQITIEFRNRQQQWVQKLQYVMDPADILIRDKSFNPHHVWDLMNNGPVASCIDLVVVGDGYAEADSALYRTDMTRIMTDLFKHEPFKSNASRFNVRVVDAYGPQSGISIPGRGQWNQTLCGTMFDTFYSDRYYMTQKLQMVHDLVAGVPYEYIFIVGNTEKYGGGGVFNSHTLVSARDKYSDVVVVHEFGHGFCGLADEYAYENDDSMDEYYDLKCEPWERNITTRVNFASKWSDMVQSGTPLPTNPDEADASTIGLFEGAGYMMHGIYRPTKDCRMRSNNPDYFCPVCTRALEEYMDFLTK